MALLCSPFRRILDGRLTVLRYRARDGRRVQVPVGYHLADGDRLVVLVGGSAGKTWWRHFRSPAPVDVWWRGRWRPAIAAVRMSGSAEPTAAPAGSHGRRPRVDSGDPVVVAEFAPSDRVAEPASIERGWWWSWTRWASLGEFLGFTVPAVTAVLVAGWSTAASSVALIAAGAVEGSLLGWAQSRVLCRRVPGVRAVDWIAGTAAGAALAWSIGLLPSITDGRLPDWPPPLLISLGVLLGVVLLASIGTAQWWVLRRHMSRSAWWIVATAAAWAAGLTIFTLFTTPLWQPDQPAWLIAGIGVVGGLLMAATVAALTGWAFVRLTKSDSPGAMP